MVRSSHLSVRTIDDLAKLGERPVSFRNKADKCHRREKGENAERNECRQLRSAAPEVIDDHSNEHRPCHQEERTDEHEREFMEPHRSREPRATARGLDHPANARQERVAPANRSNDIERSAVYVTDERTLRSRERERLRRLDGISEARYHLRRCELRFDREPAMRKQLHTYLF